MAEFGRSSKIYYFEAGTSGSRSLALESAGKQLAPEMRALYLGRYRDHVDLLRNSGQETDIPMGNGNNFPRRQFAEIVMRERATLISLGEGSAVKLIEDRSKRGIARMGYI